MQLFIIYFSIWKEKKYRFFQTHFKTIQTTQNNVIQIIVYRCQTNIIFGRSPGRATLSFVNADLCAFFVISAVSFVKWTVNKLDSSNLSDLSNEHYFFDKIIILSELKFSYFREHLKLTAISNLPVYDGVTLF